MQNRLFQSRVLLIGVGGAGSHLAVQLAAMGIGHLTVVDSDRVEASNLSRQIYFAGQVGRPKVAALKTFISSLAPEIQVETHELALTENAPWLDGLVREADLVLNCADFPSMAQTSRWLFEACYRSGVPFVPVGGYNGHLSVVPPTVLPGRSVCWYCHEKARKTKPSPNDHGILLSSLPLGSFLPAVAATTNIQAMEVVRILTGFEAPRHCGRWGEFDLRDCTLEWEEVQADPRCRFCSSAPPATSRALEIPAGAA
jgi:molybdopterin/thiamine biosynthesis adenylyltransferase